MKTKFKSDEIAHVWAHKSAPRGTSPGAMSFEGDAFKSYAAVIARHITHEGKAAIIINDSSYSVTTSKHQNVLRRAIPAGVQLFHIDGQGTRDTRLDPTGAELFQHAIEKAAEYERLAQRARTRKDSLLGASAGWLEQARSVSKFFGLRRKVDEKAIARFAEAKERAERKAEKERKARDAALMAEQSEKYEAWKRGDEDHGWGFTASLFPVAFRIEETFDSGPELVSTLGARVPLKDAKRAFAFALKHRNAEWHRNGERFQVGMYQLDSINAEGIKAGCHRISWEEIERLTPILSK